MERVWGKILVVLLVLGAPSAHAGYGTKVVNGVKLRHADDKGALNSLSKSISEACAQQNLKKCDVPPSWDAGVNSAEVAVFLEQLAEKNSLDRDGFESYTTAFANEMSKRGGGFLGKDKTERNEFLRESMSKVGVNLEVLEKGGYRATTIGTQMNDVYKNTAKIRAEAPEKQKERTDELVKAFCPGGKCPFGIVDNNGALCSSRNKAISPKDCLSELQGLAKARVASATSDNVADYEKQLKELDERFAKTEPALSKAQPFSAEVRKAMPKGVQPEIETINRTEQYTAAVKAAVGEGASVLCVRERGRKPTGVCEPIYASGAEGQLLSERLEDLTKALQSCSTPPAGQTAQKCATNAYDKAKLVEQDFQNLRTNKAALEALVRITQRVAPALEPAKSQEAQALLKSVSEKLVAGVGIEGANTAKLLTALEKYNCSYLGDARVISAPVVDAGKSCRILAPGAKGSGTCQAQICEAKVHCVREGEGEFAPVLSFHTACGTAEVSGAGCGGKVGDQLGDVGKIRADLQKCFKSQVAIGKPKNTLNVADKTVTSTMDTQGAF